MCLLKCIPVSLKKKKALPVINNNLDNLIHQEMGDEDGPFNQYIYIDGSPKKCLYSSYYYCYMKFNQKLLSNSLPN